VFNQPPSFTQAGFKQHWVYDDPSGVPEPAPFPRAWPRRNALRSPRVSLRPRVRMTHREA
jgi:hypothetical protein